MRNEACYSDARGRPLSYSAETDNQIANWVRNHTDQGLPITNSELRKHAKGIVSKENANFTASASWAQNFLLRHKLSLHPNTDSNKSQNNSSLSSSQSCGLVESVDTSNTLPSSISPRLKNSLSLMDSSSSSSLVTTRATTAPPTHSPATSVPFGAPLSTTTATEDAVTSTLALLTGEASDHLTQSQAAALASLTELTGDAASLVDLLNSAQEVATCTSDGNMGFAQSSLGSSSSQSLYLPDLMVPPSSFTTDSEQVLGSLNPAMIPIRTDSEVIHTCSRPLSYTKETDLALARWVKDQQAAGHKVTFASLRSYAKKLVSSENPHFNASVGWVTPFLLRHNLDLKINDKRRPTRKTATPRKLQAKGEELLAPEAVTHTLDETGDTLNTPIDRQVILDSGSLSVNVNAISLTPAVSKLHTTPVTSSATPQSVVKEIKPAGLDELLPRSKRARMSSRTRHTLAEKLEVVRLMKQMNMAGHYVSRILGIANSTIAGWVKLVEQKGAELEALSTNRKRSNRAGQGRPLSYSREKDEAIARWVCQQQEMGVQVTAADLTNYASSVIGEENGSFVASVGWRHKFLQRHGLQLSKPDRPASSEEHHSIPIAVQTEEVCTDEYNPEYLDRLYPEELDHQIVEWVKSMVAENGNLSVQALCRKAEDVILPVNPVFVGTLGWALKFLHCNNIFLDPKPVNIDLLRKRSPPSSSSEASTPKKPPTSFHSAAVILQEEPASVSPRSGNLCEALLALSNLQDQDEQSQDKLQDNSEGRQSTYFGKPARELTPEEKEEVVRYANATTLQKAAIKYGVAAPTVWRWRMELKLHQPKYTPMQKKYIIKCAETNTLKDAAQRFGITTKTVQNWRRALQVDGMLTDDTLALPPGSLEGQTDAEVVAAGLMGEEVIPMDNSHFQYVVDGGEVSEGNRIREPDAASPPSTIAPAAASDSTPLEVTHEIQVQDVGMEYDVISSEGHVAKPRCTPAEKLHILQYALDHSIKDASQKFGISPGTLYYWKKNFVNQRGKPQASGMNTSGFQSASYATAATVGDGSFPQVDKSGLETTVVNVTMPPDVSVIAEGGSGIMQPSSVDAIQALATSVEASVLPQSLADPLNPQSTATSTDLIQAITQTLASATPEQLQSLQQITSDLNLLQAVTSLVAAQDQGGGESGHVQQVVEELPQRHDSTGGGISSPTDVLVSFQPSGHTVEVQTTSESSIPEQSTTVSTVATPEVQLPNPTSVIGSQTIEKID